MEDYIHRMRRWKLKGDQHRNDHWVSFIIYWMIFDAFITMGSNQDSDNSKLTWFCDNESRLKNTFKKFWKQPEYVQLLEKFKELSPIDDMRPTFRSRQVFLENITDENEIFMFIYQIRCNTFHGAKDSGVEKDNKLTMAAEILLNEPLHVYLRMTTPLRKRISVES